MHVEDEVDRGVRLLKEKDGEGVKVLKKVVEERTAELGERAVDRVLGSACYALGYAHDAGLGVERDGVEAMKWIHRSRAHGNTAAAKVVFARRREFARRRGHDVVMVLCLVVFVAVGKTLFDLIYVLVNQEEFKNEVSGADPKVASYEWRVGALNASARADMTQRALELVSMTDAKNPLSDSFSHSRGVVAHFTRDALDDPLAFGSDALRWLRDGYFRHVLDDRCNAFVFNVLIVPPGRSKNRTRAVDFHVDQTLIQSTTQREQTAFTVSVGYVKVPHFIDGGDLELNRRKHPPSEGSILVFRGDQNHAVSAFCAAQTREALVPPRADCDIDPDPDLQRISFVLEQYRLDDAKLRRSPSFIIAPSKFEQDAIPLATAFPLGVALVELWLQLRKRFFFALDKKMSPRSDL